MIPNLGYRTSRFIPAGAGNSDLKIASQYWRAVYPRWRGELSVHPDSRPCDPGLSPLARGTLLLRWRFSLAQRFIPAGAGNSSSFFDVRKISAVYPRWRGELSFPMQNAAFLAGLSPLARGTQWQAGNMKTTERFIPAGAGNSSSCSGTSVEVSVYPRWRGELSINPHQLDVCGGLSPLARGTLILVAGVTGGIRFIPAGAGNSTGVNYSTTATPVYPRWRGELR